MIVLYLLLHDPQLLPGNPLRDDALYFLMHNSRTTAAATADIVCATTTPAAFRLLETHSSSWAKIVLLRLLPESQTNYFLSRNGRAAALPSEPSAALGSRESNQ